MGTDRVVERNELVEALRTLDPSGELLKVFKAGMCTIPRATARQLLKMPFFTGVPAQAEELDTPLAVAGDPVDAIPDDW